MVITKSKVKIQELGFECILGTLSFERVQPQPVVMDLVLELDFSEAAASGNVNYTVNYAEVSEVVTRFVQESKFELVETLVTKVAERLLNDYKKLNAVEVSIKKPKAIPNAIASAEIRMER